MGADELSTLAAPVVMIVVTLSVAGVVLLRPLVGRLAALLDVMARDRAQPRIEHELRRRLELLESVEARVSLMEERQNFTEALLELGSEAGRDGRRPLS